MTASTICPVDPSFLLNVRLFNPENDGIEIDRFRREFGTFSVTVAVPADFADWPSAERVRRFPGSFPGYGR